MKTLLLALLLVGLGAGAAFAQCSGDLAASQAGCTVIGIQKRAVSPQPPTDGQVLAYSATTAQYQPTTAGAGATGANPTATIGTAAVNGSAATFMRSDGAPAAPVATNAVKGMMEGDTTTISCAAGVCSAVAATARAATNKTVATPGTVTATSPTYLMLGLGGTITPTVTGKVSVSICGSTTDAALADVLSEQISYGTGAAPSNGGALAGTQVGAVIQQSQAVATDVQSFCSTAVITGLTVGTAYWLDLAVGSSGGEAITFGSTNVAAGEI